MKPARTSPLCAVRSLAICVALCLFSLAFNPASAQERPIRVLFLHHSTGEGLINEGGVREGLTALGHEFFDHGYNDDGLRLADGSYTGTHFDVPGDNTDPDGFADIFQQPLHDPPDNTFSHLLQYDVIAFKSCFPACNIGSDEMLAEYQTYYRSIRDRTDQQPEKLFIVVTPPPQVPANSDAEEAARARAFADWLQSDEYLAGHPNLFVFDFFDLLAGSDSFLRAEYRSDEYDAHPNGQANRDIGPLFVTYIDQAIQSYYADGPPPAPVAPLPAEEPDDESPAVIAPPPAASTIDDFESAAGAWNTYVEAGSTIECGPETGTARSGSGALRMDHEIALYGWGDCARDYEDAQNWSDGTGLSLWVHSDAAGKELTLMLFSGDQDGPTPFEVYFRSGEASTEGWEQHSFLWTEFERAEWADEGGLDEIDPSRMTGYGFTVSADEEATGGSLWIDDVELTSLETQPISGEAEPVTPEEEGPAGGLCSPFAALLLPAAAVIARRR